ncbi:MAG: CPBP family intramembrane metalloprotease [Oscillospiraceae bacterium]|nr:CPBP family intramembrane metalloprotease [Oscillospiraceae bacterium]
MNGEKYVFQSPLTKGESIAAWFYLPIHAIILPLLLPLVNTYAPTPMDTVGLNYVYYTIGVVFTAIFMHRSLRASFDRALDDLGRFIITLVMGFFLYYVLTYVTALLLIVTEAEISNPNNEAINEVTESSYGMFKGVGIFIVPIIEETLYRGCVFGTLRSKNRIAAYAVSIVLFALSHVWQYAVAYSDPVLLVYALQYVPLSVVLTWMYDRTGSLWTPIFFHMGVNALSFWAMGL